MICPSCNQETEEGKFCTNCGSPLHQQGEPESTSTERNAEVHTETPQQESATTSEASSEASQFNATFEKVKTGSNNYWNYFITRIKNPNVAFKDNESHVTNSIITAIILSLATVLFFYGILNTLFNDTRSFGSNESLSNYVPFFSTILKGILIFIILFFAGLIANFTTFKLVKHPISFIHQFTRYTGTLVPFTGLFVALAILSLLGIVKIDLWDILSRGIQIIETGSYGTFPWGIAFITFLFIIIMYVNPLIHMMYALIQEKTKLSFYFTIVSFIITLVIVGVLNNFFITDTITNIIEPID
ncbi:zinc ribbon domain-containing protein [Oceanobacillus timonensis]|uniref:zinc ribbon domain-containing protein n=1 Tax=Oceanobacillus timonensis TaxID=1926285 RepID=UPI0009BAFD63|nr:zinc ribbon domain-containing protein [Oceanobacillus timonensis]